ncbi:MAG TPA: MFS transporter [Burkholderiaceae bacterium]|jgi:MFS family permease|nr:MFS transporter [Burkholderiaceae bacterium]
MPAESVRGARLVALMCGAEVLSMAGFSAYPALLPTLRDAWNLNGFQAGLVGGAFFFGYMVAVPFLAGVTDRVDARSVFAASCALASIGTAGFAVFARGALTGALFQALTGAGLAGTYMPGLKALTDRVGGPHQARHVAFYTASFGIGTSLSLALAGRLAAALPWRQAFAALALGPLLALALVALRVNRQSPAAASHTSSWPRLRSALAHPGVRRYALGYSVHCWELFGLRSWLVAFIAFARTVSGSACPWLNATDAAALINLLGLPASVFGNEWAGRVGRIRWIALAMACAAALSWLTGLAAVAPWWITLGLLAAYFVCVMADSAALTAGLVAAAPPAQRGAALAVYSLLGFGAGFVAPMVFGATLDAAGGGPFSWVPAFATLSAGGLLWAYAARKSATPPMRETS